MRSWSYLEGLECFVEEGALGLPVAVDGQLLVGEEEGRAGVLDARDGEAESGGVREDAGHGVEEFGRPARLEDDLVRVDEEARLGEDVRVKVRVGANRDDLARGQRHEGVQIRAREHAEALRRAGGEQHVNLDALLAALKVGRGVNLARGRHGGGRDDGGDGGSAQTDQESIRDREAVVCFWNLAIGSSSFLLAMSRPRKAARRAS